MAGVAAKGAECLHGSGSAQTGTRTSATASRPITVDDLVIGEEQTRPVDEHSPHHLLLVRKSTGSDWPTWVGSFFISTPCLDVES